MPRKRKSRQRSRRDATRSVDPHQIDWRAVRWEQIDRCMARFEGGSLAELLGCAADSPGGVHRLPSLTILWMRCLAAPPAGQVTASPAHMRELLAAAGRAARQLRILEDFAPADPRLVVRYAVAGNRFRIHPGSLGDPVQTLRAITATAEAIDPFVIERHGFSLSDLIEVALRYSDCRMATLSDHWPSGEMPAEPRDSRPESLRAHALRIARTPAAVTDAEIAAARTLHDNADGFLSACANPDRAAAAWRWATQPASALNIDLFPGAEHLGPVFAVSAADGDWPVPAALLISALAAAAGELAREAARDEVCTIRMHLVTQRRALGIFGISPPGTPGGTAVVVPGHRHAFVAGIASGLDHDSLIRSLADAADEADGITAEMIQQAGGSFDPGGSVFRFIIYGGPVRGPAGRRDGQVCVHVDELLSAALDADDAAAGEGFGRDLLWQFIDELATLPGVTELSAWDFSDIWQVWLSRGTLNPGGHRDQQVVVVTLPDNETWERAAAWEPLEMVLTGAGLPTSWEWTFAQLDEPGQATVGFLHNIFLLLADPKLVLHVPLEHELADLGIDPAFAIGVAEGIRLTVLNNPGVASVLLAASAAPLVCHLRLQSDRLPDTPAGHVGVRMAASAGPVPSIDLIFGADWLELLAEDPGSGHGVLGRAIAEGLRQVLNLTEQACQEFFTAWCRAVPVAALRRAHTTLPPGVQGRYRLPRSPATAARARRAVAAAIVPAEVPRAIYIGQGAFGLLREIIMPAAASALAAAVSEWSPESLITVAECLNDAHTERARRAGELALALTAPWGERWQAMALDQPEPALITRPLELVLEMLLARTSAGSMNADIFDIAEATDLANLALSVSLDLAAARSHLHGLEVILDEDGQFAVTGALPEPAGTAIDTASYQRADRADRARLRPGPLPAEPMQLGISQPGSRPEFVPMKNRGISAKLLTADVILKDACGTGFDAISAVLAIAATWTPGDAVTKVRRAEFCDAATGWSALSRAEIEAAVDRLTLAPDQLRQDEMRYWEQEKRSHRLAIRPLIRLGNDELLLIPRRLEATQGVFAAYLLDGRLPWPAPDLPRRVIDAFINYRKTQNRQLEQETGSVITGLRLLAKTNIEQHRAQAVGLRLSGEIDALAADQDRSRLWVCEVKDPAVAVSPSTIAAHVSRFLKPSGHVSHLLRNTRDIAADPTGWARLLGAPDPDRSWRILPLIITRRVEPAAFTSDPAVTYVVLEDLAALLQDDHEPALGPVWPDSCPPNRE